MATLKAFNVFLKTVCGSIRGYVSVPRYVDSKSMECGKFHCVYINFCHEVGERRFKIMYVTLKRWKLKWHGHITQSSNRTCLVHFRERGRKRGRCMDRREANIDCPTISDCLRAERDGGSWLSRHQGGPIGRDNFGIDKAGGNCYKWNAVSGLVPRWLNTDVAELTSRLSILPLSPTNASLIVNIQSAHALDLEATLHRMLLLSGWQLSYSEAFARLVDLNAPFTAKHWL